MEWEAAQSRFQELEESDDELHYGHLNNSYPQLPPGRHPSRIPPGRRLRSAYDEGFFDGEYDEDDYDSSGELQAALRMKEEELAERAQRRIHRARLRGLTSVSLTREELDALERKEAREARQRERLEREQALVKRSSKTDVTKQSKTSSASTSKKKGSSSKQKSSGKRGTDSPPVSRPGSSSPRASRTASRKSSGALRIEDRPMSSASLDRALPDDPDWQPRSRSSSVAQHYPPGADPFQYQVSGRRNVSGSSAVAYSNVRRSPTGSGPMVRVPLGGPSSPGDPPRRTSSGLSNQFVGDSSDDSENDDDNDDDDDEDSADEGVRVDVMPDHGPPMSYTPREVRARRGGRR